MARIVVVSNRVAVPTTDGGTRAGGLEVAIRSFLKRHRGLWFGWSGKVAAKADVAVREIESGGVTYITTDLTRADYQEYYNGFANRMLWPILHYRLDLAEYSSLDLTGYMRVNDHFAEQLAQGAASPTTSSGCTTITSCRSPRRCATAASRTASVSSCTCHFRRRNCSPRCPSMSGSSCRFVTTTWSASRPTTTPNNFARYLKDECRMPSRGPRTFIAGQRTVQIGIFPVGVETVEFERLARRSVRSPFVRR